MGNATTIMGIIQNDGAIKKEKKTKIRGIPRALIKFLAMELGQLSGIPSKSPLSFYVGPYWHWPTRFLPPTTNTTR